MKGQNRSMRIEGSTRGGAIRHRRAVAFFVCLVLTASGCATVPRAGTAAGRSSGSSVEYHRVGRGQTLRQIAALYGVSVREIERENRLPDARTVSEGMILRVPVLQKARPAAGTGYPAASVTDRSVVFIWPVEGTVACSFGEEWNRARNKGIDIAALEGAPVRAAQSGRIVFCEQSFRGMGKTLIIDHGGGYQTVYAYNSELLTSEGHSVKQGDQVARVGRGGRASGPSLHFEIRKDGAPCDPLTYLSRERL